MNMKTLALCICWIALAVTAPAQPPPPPSTPAPSPAVSASATVSVSPGSNLADRLHQKLDKKLHGCHGIVIDGGDKDEDRDDGRAWDLGEKMAVPIVAIVFLTIFGAPVMIVAVILYFGFSRSRMQHRTIRMMAEKGQPIPPALLAPPPPPIRQRADMRPRVALSIFRFDLTLFFDPVNDLQVAS